MQVNDNVECLADKSTNYRQIGKITKIEGDIITVVYPDGDVGKGKSKYYKLTTGNPINKVVSKVMALKELFVLGRIQEPERSYRKAGITNGDGIVTDEGAKLYLTYLLGKDDGAFKTSVVDPIIEEMKENKDK